MSRSRPTNPFIRDEPTSGSSSGPHPNKDRNSFIIVNNDIMIHPGDQLDYQTSSDDDTLSSISSSSGSRSPTSLHLPPPVSPNARTQRSPHHHQQSQQQRPTPSQLSSSSTTTNRTRQTPVAPPRKTSFEWIPTPLPTPQSRRALAHDNNPNPQQRLGQHQLRTEKQTPAAPSSYPSTSLPTSSSTSPTSPSANSSLQRTSSFSTPQRPPRPTVSPFMSDLPLYSTRTTGPPKQQQSTSNNTHDYNNAHSSHAAHSGDVELQERSRIQQQQQQRPSVARSSSLNHSNNNNNSDSYTLPAPSPSRTVDNSSSDPSLNRGDSTLDRSLSTNHSGSSGANDGGGGRRDRAAGGRTTTSTISTTAANHPTQTNKSSRSANHNALNNSSASRSSSTRVANHIDPSTGQRQELRGDSAGGGILSFFGGLFGGGGGGSTKSKQPASNAATNRTRKRKDTVGGLPASASGSKNDLIDRSQLQHHPSGEKLSGSAFVQQDPLSRKKGLPGKDGRQPETDMFNFVDTMLDMPVDPTWSQVIVKLLKVLVVMCVCYFGLMALYFGAEFQAINHTQNFEILVVDLDNSMIGSNYLNFTSHLNGVQGQPRWVNHNSTVYPSMSTIQADILNGRYWGAVVVQANASSNLLWSVANINANYDPTKAFAFIYEGGRDPLVVKPQVVATMYTTFLMFSKSFNPSWVKLAIASFENQNKSMSAIIDAPQVIGTPIAFEEFDLHPITASIITSATSVAYIWIFLVAGGSTYLVANMVQPMTTKSSTAKTMFVMLFPLLMFLVALSLCYSLLLLTFGVPFAGGAPQFFSLFGGMLLLQCAVASMVLFLIYLIPVVFIPGFTITFVIFNVIAVFNPVELMPVFYKWVYAMPFLNAVQIARYVLMGSYNRLRYNIPILSAWILFPIILMPFAISRQKRVARELEREEEEEGIKKSTGTQHKDRKAVYTKPTGVGAGTTDDDDEVVVLESKKKRQHSNNNKHNTQQQQQQKSSSRHRQHTQQEDAENNNLEDHDEETLPYHGETTVPSVPGSHRQTATHRPSAPSESRVFNKWDHSEVK
ncbi:hypothetical protein BGZ89_010809 [Linnemannia elongata]|nr:hypothetical protein BGZ89_010809 [Linnemannia elongata]